MGLGGISPERLVFIDETAALTNLVRLYGRSPRGERAFGSAPCGHWTRVSVIGALGPTGILAAMSLEAATSGAVFCAYLEQVLLPELRRAKPDAVIVMDNLSAHKTAAVRALLDASGFTSRYLPPYSPDLNPIELAWAKLKAQLRRVAAPAPPKPCRTRCNRPWQPSRPRMPKASSAMPATPRLNPPAESASTPSALK